MLQNKNLLAAFAMAGLLLAAPTVNADLTGHTNLSGGGTWTGANNWSVISDMGADAPLAGLLDTAAVDAALTALITDGTQHWYYMFNAVNDKSSSVALSSFTTNLGVLVSNPGALIYVSSYSGVVMTDGLLVPVSPDPAGNDLDGPLTGFVTGATTITPASWIANTMTNSAVATFTALPGAPTGGVSDLLLYVSTLGPGMFKGSMIDGGASGEGPSPAPIPAPGAVLLGMIGFGLVGWVKRRFA